MPDEMDITTYLEHIKNEQEKKEDSANEKIRNNVAALDIAIDLNISGNNGLDRARFIPKANSKNEIRPIKIIYK
jgi:hypothetical protein